MNNDAVHDDESGDNAFSVEVQKSIEAKIMSAAFYVVPSENLRPLALQAARDYCSDKRSNRLLVKLIWGVAIGCFLVLPMLDKANSFGNTLVSPSAEELQERAIKIAAERNVGIGWGLQEAFVEMRQEQAMRLGQAPKQEVSE